MARHFTLSNPPAIKRVTVRVALSQYPFYISSIELALDDADQTFVRYIIDRRTGYPASGSDEFLDLKDIGFVDLDIVSGPIHNADGNAVAINVRGWAYGTTRASLEEFGLWDPFNSKSFENWKNHRKYRGVEISHPPDVSTDAISGRKDLAFGYGTVPKKTVPPTQSMAQSLADVDCYLQPVSTGDRFVLRLIAPPGTSYSQNMEIAEDQRLRGLIKWFQDHTIDIGSIWAGDIKNLDGLDEVALVTAGRRYRFDMDIADGVTEEITFKVTQHDVAGSSGASLLDFHCTPFTPSDESTIDIAKILEYFNNTRVSLGTGVGDAVDVPPFGAVAIPTFGERFVLEHREIVDERTFPIWKSDDGRRQVMLSGVGETLQFDDLPDVEGETYKWLPLIGERTAIHHNGTGDAVLRIPEASKCVPIQGKDVEFESHALSTGNLEIADKDGNNIVTVHQGEHIPLRVTWLESGNTEIRSLGPVERIFEKSATPASGQVEDLGDANHIREGSFYWRELLLPGTNLVDRIHTDAFEMAGTAAFAAGSSPAKLYTPDSLRIRKAGSVLVEAGGVLRFKTAATGIISYGSLFTIKHNATFRTPAVKYGEIPSDGGNHDLHILTEFDAAVDDYLSMGFGVLGTSTVAMGNIEIAAWRLRVVQQLNILVEYA